MKNFFFLLLIGMFIGNISLAAESCTKYFDGCNTCTIENGKISCTEMACKATSKPYCIDNQDIDIQPETPSSSAKIDRVPTYNQGGKTYKFDEKAIQAINLKDSSLLKLNCDKTQILKSLGFVGNSKMFSVGLEEGDFDYTFDLRNCSMWGNKRNYTWSGKPITEKDALSKAKTFMSSSFFKGKIWSKYAEPIVIYRNANGGPILYKAEAMDSNSDIEIDPNDVGTLEPEYVSFSILFPYLVNNKPVYNAYGNKAGITLEVNAEGVTSVNSQLLLFKGAVRSSEKLTQENISEFIKRGGNNPFRGNQQEIELEKPERVNVLFTVWRNNLTELYLSSGIRLPSKVKLDQRNPQPYEMIISDYKLGNNNYGY